MPEQQSRDPSQVPPEDREVLGKLTPIQKYTRWFLIGLAVVTALRVAFWLVAGRL